MRGNRAPDMLYSRSRIIDNRESFVLLRSAGVLHSRRSRTRIECLKRERVISRAMRMGLLPVREGPSDGDLAVQTRHLQLFAIQGQPMKREIPDGISDQPILENVISQRACGNILVASFNKLELEIHK